MSMKKEYSFSESLDWAIQGIIFAFKYERNFRIDFLAAIIVILCGVIINLSRLELVAIILTIAFVLSAELFNTAIEKSLDIVNNSVDSRVKFVKDVSAGATLITVLASISVGFLIFYPHLERPFEVSLRAIKSIPLHIIIAGVFLVMFLVIIIKSLAGDRFLRGGIVSGHAAVAFSMATIIFYFSNSLIVATLGFILAFLVAQSRVEGKIHSVREVILGSLLGIIVMLTILNLVLK
ncbi:MAG: diacylglycerol kinase [bacterium]